MNEGQSLLNLPLNEMYKVVGRIVDNGMNQYPIMKSYHDQTLQKKSKSMKNIYRRLPQINKSTYLDDQHKIHKNMPGPGQYNIISQSTSNMKNMQFMVKRVTQKRSYLDQIIKRSKSPGPGKYYPENNQQKIKHKSSNKKSSNNPQRQNYLTQVQYAASKLPGVGQYDVRKRVNTQFNRMQTSPQKYIKHEKKRASSQKKLSKVNQLPSIGSYNPFPSSYQVFQMMSLKKTKTYGFGKGQRFKTQNDGSGLSPDKYGAIHEWMDYKLKNKYQRKGLDILTKGHQKSIYY